MAKVNIFKASTLEMLANAIADTDPAITGSVIHRMLLQSQIEDVSYNEQFLAKRKKLFNAFVDYQNKNQCANNIILFIQNILSPQRYVDNAEMYHKVKSEVNKQLAFEGLSINESNQIVAIEKASKISDVQIKVDGLKAKLVEQGAHQLVFSYCNAELLANNYFHSVLESSKGLVKRIQDLAGVTYDGQNLMEKVFKDDEPILIINNFQSKSEKDEHRGFRNLLIGIVAMFRNPASHELKVEWNMSEQDALDILAMISYCHRRLDNAQRIRLG
ncbi:MAG: TIGR02391 family protein [Prevotella sp.]|nr:TIGR02391 family protein [Prevotella sp.]